MNLNIVCLYAQIIGSFKCLWHDRSRELVPKVVETCSHQFFLGEFLWALKSKAPLSHDEVCDFLSLGCLGSNHSGTPTAFGYYITTKGILLLLLAN